MGCWGIVGYTKMFVSGGTTSSWHQHVRSGATAATVPLLSLLGESPHTVAHALFGSALGKADGMDEVEPVCRASLKGLGRP